MSKNRELSQLGSLVIVDDSNKNIGIGTTEGSVGIGTVSYTHLTLPTTDRV